MDASSRGGAVTRPYSRTAKAIALSLGQLLTGFIGLISMMILTRVLSSPDFATYRQTILAYDTAMPLLSLGIASGLFYFLPTAGDRFGSFVANGIVTLTVVGILYAAFLLLGGDAWLARRFSNPPLTITLRLLAPLPIFMLPATLLAPVMVAQDRIPSLASYNIFSGLCLAVAVIATSLLLRTPAAAVTGRVIAGVVAGAAALWLMLTVLPPGPAWPSVRGAWQLVSFSVPLALASTLGSLSLILDKLIVSTLCTPEDFAIYSVGSSELPFIGVVTGSIMTVLMPDLRRLTAAGDFEGAVALFAAAAAKSGAVLLPVAVFLAFNAESFLETFFSSRYNASTSVFRLYLMVIPMRLVVFGSMMTALGMNRVILIRSAFGLLTTAILGTVFVRHLGYLGAACATIVSLYTVEGALSIASIARATGCRWWKVVPFGELLQTAGLACLAAMTAAVSASAIVWSDRYPPISLLANLLIFALVFFVLELFAGTGVAHRHAVALRSGQAIFLNLFSSARR
jgi:O-antigen/teichoic acid export membrane protein